MQTALIIFAALFAPIPWFITGIHFLIKTQRWSSGNLNWFLIVLLFLSWGILLWWGLKNSSIVFENLFAFLPLHVLGVVVLLAATIIEILTSKTLGVSRVFGSSELKQKKDDRLITSGIYAYARHPRYLEHPFWALGLGLLFGSPFLLWFSLYMFISFSITAYFEEQELLLRYGKEYLEYKKKVPAFFIV